MAKRDECPNSDNDCVQEDRIEEMEDQCSEVLQRLPKVTSDFQSLENRLSLYSKVALAFVTILCGIATYGFFELNDFRKEYHKLAKLEQTEKLKFQKEIRSDLYDLERKIYDRDEQIMEKLNEVEKNVASIAARMQ